MDFTDPPGWIGGGAAPVGKKRGRPRAKPAALVKRGYQALVRDRSQENAQFAEREQEGGAASACGDDLEAGPAPASPPPGAPWIGNRSNPPERPATCASSDPASTTQSRLSPREESRRPRASESDTGLGPLSRRGGR